MSYCQTAPGHPFHGPYHDQEYGFPATGDRVLLERLALEINQAGLNWLLVLKKREAFFEAFSGFEPDAVAAYGEADITRLMGNAAIIRNRRKIEAVIDNARRFGELRQSHGSVTAWLEDHHPASLEDWVRLFRGTFVFTGGEIVNEFLMSLGYLPGAHDRDCPVFARIEAQHPPWMRG